MVLPTLYRPYKHAQKFSTKYLHIKYSAQKLLCNSKTFFEARQFWSHVCECVICLWDYVKVFAVRNMMLCNTKNLMDYHEAHRKFNKEAL